MLQEYEVTSIFKPNAPITNVEDLGKLHKHLTKEDHIIIVAGTNKQPEYNSPILSQKGHQLHCTEDKKHKCGICKPLQEAQQAVDEQEGEECEFTT